MSRAQARLPGSVARQPAQAPGRDARLPELSSPPAQDLRDIQEEHPWATAWATPVTPAEPARQRGLLTLVVNGAEHGDVAIIVREGEVWASADGLAESGLSTEGASLATIDGAPFVALGGAPGLFSYRVDEADLRLELEADPQRLTGTEIDLRSTRPEIEFSADPSAFLNYGVRLLDQERPDGYAELGFSRGAALAYTGVTVPYQVGPVRGLTNLTFDSLALRRRWVFGDALAHGGTLGGSAYLGGIQLGHTNTLDPYFVPGTSFDQHAMVLAPSTLEVYVNDRLVHREQVAPGPLDVKNLPVTAGAGDTRVVLRDALGREQQVSASYYRPIGLLAAGDQEYTYSLGFQREELGSSSWAYGPPAIIGTHRLGVTPNLTAGARGEAALDRVSGGLNAVAGVGFGQIGVDGSVSVSPEGPGTAAAVSYGYLGDPASGSIWVRYRSDGYTTIGLDVADDRTTEEAGASVGVPITERCSLSLAYSVSNLRDSGVGQRASLSGGLQLPWDLQLGALLAWSQLQDDPGEVTAWLSLTRMLGQRRSGVVRAESAGDLQSGVAELSQALPVGSGVGYRAGARTGDIAAAYGYVDGHASFGQANAGLAWTPDGASSELGVAGGLVAIGGRVAPSRPVERGYALVQVPDVAGVRVYLNNNEVGRTDRRGDLVLTGLEPYYGNRVGIADLDVPLDYAIASVERVIAPPNRGGAVVAFPVARARIVRGRLEAPGADLAYGEVRVAMGEETVRSPIAKDGSFELDIPAGSWSTEVLYAGGACSTTLVVPPSDVALMQLGVVRCTPSTRSSVP